MKKTVIAMFTLLFGIAQQTTGVNVDAILYVDTEMPCLREFEKLSGRIVIRNHGEDDIKLIKGTPVFPEMLAFHQLYLFPDISVQEEERITARPAQSPYIRARIKNGIDSWVQRNQDIMTLKKGETLEVNFEHRELEVLHGAGNRLLPFKAELYLSPNTWIPIEVQPPIMVACGAKFIPLTVTETGVKYDRDAVRISRVQIGTNEFLLASEKFSYYRLIDLQPDDTVTHSNKVITITQKNGKVLTIPEADIARVSAERAEGKRKARQLETEN